jgi:hypothetical protein
MTDVKQAPRSGAAGSEQSATDEAKERVHGGWLLTRFAEARLIKPS